MRRLLLLSVLLAGCAGGDPAVLQREISYLQGVEEVAWVEIDGNDVYIGVGETTEDLSAIVNAAALNGNRATDFGVHVWAVRAERGWRPGTPGLVCQATARSGRLETPCQL